MYGGPGSDLLIKIYIIVLLQDLHVLHAHDTWPCTRSQIESKSRNRVSARAKLEVFNVFYAYFILLSKKTLNTGYFIIFQRYLSTMLNTHSKGPSQVCLSSEHLFHGNKCFTKGGSAILPAQL